MKKILLAALCMASYHGMCQNILMTKDYSEPSANIPVNYLNSDFKSQYTVNGNLGTEVYYSFGYNTRKDYAEGDLAETISTAKAHLLVLADSLNDPYAQKTVTMVLYPDGSTASFRIDSHAPDTDLAYYNGSYERLKSGYDTLRIVRRIPGRKEEAGTVAYYTIVMKDLVGFAGDPVDTAALARENKRILKAINRDWIFDNFNTSIAVGGFVNSRLPVGPYLDLSLMYVFRAQGSHEVHPFIGLFISSAAGLLHDTVFTYGTAALEFGAVRYDAKRNFQKYSVLLGLQYRNTFYHQDKRPAFMWGLDVPISNKFSVGLQFAQRKFWWFRQPTEEDSRMNIMASFKFRL